VALVFGLVARMPLAGIAWQTLHYLEGLRRCGWNAYYVEDCWDWPYDADRGTVTDDPSFTAGLIDRLTRWAGMEGQWVYRGPTREVLGVSEAEYSRLLSEAELLVNLSGATELLDEHSAIPVRIYLETDPVLPQIGLALGHDYVWSMVRAHTHHFTFAENYGAPDCEIPVIDEIDYQPTRQPVVLEWWETRPPHDPDAPFSTVATWNQAGDKDVEWEGRQLMWSKHEQFLRFLDLPRITGQRMELALATADPEVPTMLEARGWSVSDAFELSNDILTYRDYIQRARGEFSVAKGQVVHVRSGWFSDRSACYLAAGRPVVLQATGFECALPTGRGLFAFADMDEAAAAMAAIEADYEGNSDSAREIARECFAAERVVGSVLERAGL
jgi:hypothetical protein